MLDLVPPNPEDAWDLAATLGPMLQQNHAVEQDVFDEAEDVCKGEGCLEIRAVPRHAGDDAVHLL